MEASLIAPCGMNCGLCLAYLREKDQCPGCLSGGTINRKGCVHCSIKNCQHRFAGGFTYCYDCEVYPCKRMKELDKRYRTKYNMSMFENLKTIKELGMDEFLERELARWTCSECGGAICVHRGFCLDCRQNSKPVL